MRLHSYDLEGRGKVTVFLTATSVLLAWLLDIGLDAANFEPQWWLYVPSFAGFYSTQYWLFDNYVWRWRLWRNLGLLMHDVSVSIIQRWSKLLVRLETESSKSHSLSGALTATDVGNPELSYLYINEPKALAPNAMNTHRGTAILELKGNVLEGDYYTGRGRTTYGSMKVAKVICQS